MDKKLEGLLSYWQSRGIVTDKKVFAAFSEVKREIFVPPELRAEAYADVALPIGHGQTISQPSTVAAMTQALELRAGQKVLEVGTGSGYQAALIACVVGARGKIFSTEIIPELVALARKNLFRAKVRNVQVLEMDGSEGYAKEAPYDRIILTAATPRVPLHLLLQLKEEGILLAPVGGLFGQEMIRVRKLQGGKIQKENLGEYIFVPLRGKKGF